MSAPRRERPVHAVIVGVPARNERRMIRRTLQSLADAASEVDPHVIVRVVVACDSCDDTTAIAAKTFTSQASIVRVIEGEWRSAGGARRAAIEFGLDELLGLGLGVQDVWIATTDADTVVPRNWISRHLDHAREGYDAVAGVVELLPDRDCTPATRRAFRTTYVVGTDEHEHVHGANMGIRADSYLDVDGFPPIGLAEDHALWAALQSADIRCVSSVSLKVWTSSRLRGRAPGGFADVLGERVRQMCLDQALDESA